MPLLSFDLHEEEEEEDDEEDDEDVLFFCLLRQAKEKQALRRHSRFRKAHYHNLRAFARRLRDRRVPRVGLVSPSASPWQKLYSSGTDQGMVTATGLDHRTFEYVLASFKPLYDMHTVDKVTGEIRTRKKKGGRPRLLDAAACLGLTLMWTRTQGSDWALSILLDGLGLVVVVVIRLVVGARKRARCATSDEGAHHRHHHLTIGATLFFLLSGAATISAPLFLSFERELLKALLALRSAPLSLVRHVLHVLVGSAHPAM